MPTDQTIIGTGLPQVTADLVTLAYALAILPAMPAAKVAALPLAIADASEAVRDHCRRDFARLARDEVQDGDGSDSLVLAHYPVESVQRIATVDDDGTEEDLAPADYRVNKKAGIVRLIRGRVPEGYDNVRVQYTAGPAAVPGPVQEAAVQVAKALLDQAHRDTTIDSERWADYSFTRNQLRKDAALPETAKDLLAPYRDCRA